MVLDACSFLSVLGPSDGFIWLFIMYKPSNKKEDICMRFHRVNYIQKAKTPQMQNMTNVIPASIHSHFASSFTFKLDDLGSC